MNNITVKKLLIEIVSSLFIGLGLFLAIIMPFIQNWFIHGSRERYIWILNGPDPFNSWGGGPTQGSMIFTEIMIGAFLFIIGFIIRATYLNVNLK